jgi:hypothetical protein
VDCKLDRKQKKKHYSGPGFDPPQLQKIHIKGDRMKKKPEVSPEIRRLLHSQFPTKKDVEYVATHIQRHTKGIEGWWGSMGKDLGPHAVINTILTVWEAGRLEKVGL